MEMRALRLCFPVLVYSLVTLFPSSSSQDICKFGPRCLYPCHCRFNAPCNSTTGACETGCDDSQPPSPWSGPTVPWSGPGCQVGNLAPGKFIEPRVASPTAYTWRIDLGAFYAIQQIVIPKRPDLGILRSTQVRIFKRINTASKLAVVSIPLMEDDDDYTYELCLNIDVQMDLDMSADNVTITCARPMLGRFVYLHNVDQNPGYMNYLRGVDIIIIGYLVPLNAALHKHVYSTNDGTIGGPAKLVDGFTDPYYQERHSNCYTPAPGASIVIDLGKVYSLKNFYLTNPFYPIICFTGGTSVHVNMANETDTTGGTPCGTTLGPHNRNKHLSVACAVETQARYVRLYNHRANPIRSYCELIAEVGIDEVVPDGYFGPAAFSVCNCKVPCNKITGICPNANCNDGYQGNDCQQECDDGWYGAGCSKPCHCAGSEVCEKVTGMCANGCPDARFGDGCPFTLPHYDDSLMVRDITTDSAVVYFPRWDESMRGQGPVTEYRFALTDVKSAFTRPFMYVKQGTERIIAIDVIRLEPDTDYEVVIAPRLNDNDTMRLGMSSDPLFFKTKPSPSSSLSGGAIAGITVAILVVLLIIGCAVFCCCGCCCICGRQKRDTVIEVIKERRPRSFAYNQNQRNNLANANNVSGSATPAGMEFEPTTKGKVLNTYSKPVLVGPPKSKSGEMAKQSNTEKSANAQRRQKPAAKPPVEAPQKPMKRYDPNVDDCDPQTIYANMGDDDQEYYGNLTNDVIKSNRMSYA